MNEKKYFNNLPDSIFITVLFFQMLLLLSIAAVYTALYESFSVCLWITLVWCGVFLIPLALAIIFGCYEYWYIKDNTLFCKKLLRKEKCIRLPEITKAEKRSAAIVSWTRKYRNAYILHGNGEKFMIVINRKNEQYLNETFEKYIKISNTFRK